MCSKNTITQQAIVNLARPESVSKVSRILHYMTHGHHVNFQVAANELNDKHLNSTISNLRNTCGMTVRDKWIYVVGFEGSQVRCKEYWLDNSSQNLEVIYRFLRLSGWHEGPASQNTPH